MESTSHFLLHCPIFNDEKYTLRSTFNKSDCKLLTRINEHYFFSHTRLYGNTFDKEKKLILHATTAYILFTENSKTLLFSKFLL